MERQTTSRENLTQQEKIGILCQMFNIRDTEAESILKECRDNLETATTVLYSSLHHIRPAEGAEQGHVTQGGGDPITGPLPVPVVNQATGTENNPIDLTGEGDQDLQKALALSLQVMKTHSESAAISLEEQELSRALEASIADNNANMARMGMPVTSVFVDPLNPHDRKRERDMPVGLKNIGNTCWFSAVIQSLFHIPRFCHLILSYRPPPLPPGVIEYPHCVHFVLELQKLFSFLHHSHRKYISPDLAIQSLKEAFTKGYRHTGAQQDVSEFTHKLLEWIEDAFKLSHGPEEPNPIVELFNGHSKTEGVINGEKFTNESRFGAFPVQVHSHTHLHDSLDASTFTAELNQETWFTRLPPILVLELSRFQFNQARGQAEKVHDMLRFDTKMFLDRYLEKNKEEARRRRIDVKRLKEKLSELERRLASYSHYDQKPVSIIDTLSMTLKFVRQQVRGADDERDNGGERAGKRPRTSLHPVPRFVSSQEMEVMEGSLNRWIEELTQDVDELQESIAATKLTLDAVYGDPLMNTTPYNLHAVLVHQGQASGGHYWAYIRRLNNPFLRGQSTETVGSHGQSHDQSHDLEPVHDVADTVLKGQDTDDTSQTGQTSGNETGQTSQTSQSLERTESLESAPDSASTCMSETKTHRTGLAGGRTEGMEVDRGGGVASAEAFVRVKGDGEAWLKFNDVSVSDVGWDEVLRESLGGGVNNTSAYCLIYVNEELHHQMKQGWQPCVSEELQKYVQGDNERFSLEIAQFDEKQKRILPAGHIGSNEDMPMRGPNSSPTSEVAPAMLALAAPPERGTRGAVGSRNIDRSPEQMQIEYSPVLPPIDPQLTAELRASMELLMKQVNNLVGQDSFVDPRPMSIITYAILSKAPLSVTKPLVLEGVASLTEKEALQLLAKKEYFHSLSEPGTTEKLDNVRTNFRLFCGLCWTVIEAVNAMREERWGDVLTYSVHAYNLHSDLRQVSTSDDFNLQNCHVAKLVELRKKGIQGVSQLAYKLFEENNVHEALKQANTLLLPGLRALTANSSRGDEEVVEAVREKWCQYLNHPGLNEDEQDQLGDLLTRLFEDSTQASLLPQPTIPDTLDHHQLTVDLSSALTHLMTSSLS